jgi:hypothetical protein
MTRDYAGMSFFELDTVAVDVPTARWLRTRTLR